MMLTAVLILIIVIFSTSPPLIVLETLSVNIITEELQQLILDHCSCVWRGALFAGLRIVFRSTVVL